MSSTKMPATEGRSEACCNVPPVVVKDYETKGAYDEVDGLKTYVTGPEDAKKAILVTYDIFGYFPQTLQGADILAFSGEEKYRVLLPDWFEGNPCPIEWYPPVTEQQQKDLGAWFSNWPFDKLVKKIPEFMKAAEAKYPGLEWALAGYCWGGKITTLIATKTDLFKAAVSLHPADVDPKDAEKVKIPIAMLASQDEDANACKAWGEALKVPNYVERFDTQIHGWMAARGNLEDEKVREEYIRGYKAVLEFLGKNF